MKGNYDDIIRLPRHVSYNRKKMSAAERAAQFSPFAALTGFDVAIRESGRLTDEPAELEEDEINLINSKLALLYKYQSFNPGITVNYFVPDSRKRGGEFVTITGNVGKVDSLAKRVLLTDGTVIAFGRIRWIQSPTEEELGLLYTEEKTIMCKK